MVFSSQKLSRQNVNWSVNVSFEFFPETLQFLLSAAAEIKTVSTRGHDREAPQAQERLLRAGHGRERRRHAGGVQGSARTAPGDARRHLQHFGRRRAGGLQFRVTLRTFFGKWRILSPSLKNFTKFNRI